MKHLSMGVLLLIIILLTIGGSCTRESFTNIDTAYRLPQVSTWPLTN